MRPGVEIASPPIPGHTGPATVITAAAKVGYESPLTTSAGAVDTPLQRRKVSAAGRHERGLEQTLGFAQDRRWGEISLGFAQDAALGEISPTRSNG